MQTVCVCLINFPDLTDTQVMNKVLEEVANHLTGGTGPRGVDSSHLSQWMLKHGRFSSPLRKTLTSLA